MKKCPKCEINYIDDDKELCPVCSGSQTLSSSNKHYATGDSNIFDDALSIRIKAQMSVVRSRCGYDVFDLFGNILGVVFESDVPGTARYKMAEIAFLPSLGKQYGDWRVIKINGGYLPFEHLKRILSKKDEYVCTTDQRSRKLK